MESGLWGLSFPFFLLGFLLTRGADTGNAKTPVAAEFAISEAQYQKLTFCLTLPSLTSDLPFGGTLVTGYTFLPLSSYLTKHTGQEVRAIAYWALYIQHVSQRLGRELQPKLQTLGSRGKTQEYGNKHH